MNKMMISLSGLLFVCFASTAFAGRVGGPGHTAESAIDPGVTSVTSDFYEGGKVARILVTSRNNADIDCIVRDADGDIQAADLDDSGTCLLVFVPEKTGKFTVRTTNVSSKATVISLQTN